jgi:uncharacterized protein (TIGR00297 family)
VFIPWLAISIGRSFLADQLACAYVAHFATANGDTWASELGILSANRPRLITSLFLREVPSGTNGGMSIMGTAASAAGGAVIGLTYSIMSFAYPGSRSQLPMVLFAMVCGMLGSLLDSLLGATLQATYYSNDKKCIVKLSHAVAHDLSIVHICGMDMLSNELVNVLSIALTMVLSLFLAPAVFALCDMQCLSCYVCLLCSVVVVVVAYIF